MAVAAAAGEEAAATLSVGSVSTATEEVDDLSALCTPRTNTAETRGDSKEYGSRICY